MTLDVVIHRRGEVWERLGTGGAPDERLWLWREVLAGVWQAKVARTNDWGRWRGWELEHVYVQPELFFGDEWTLMGVVDPGREDGDAEALQDRLSDRLFGGVL